MYDVTVIGAGVVGAFIARELSRYRLKVCLLDRETDVAMGTSRANSAIVHAGYDAEPGTRKAELNVLGNRMMEQVCRELKVPFKRIGSMVLCFRDEEKYGLQKLMEKGEKNGVRDLNIISGEEARRLEKNLSEEVKAALVAPSAGIVCPYELTLSAAENAVNNGTELKLNCSVTAIRFIDGIFRIHTSRGELQSRYVVNAAGVYADNIANMIGDFSFSIIPRKGEYILYDKKLGDMVQRVIFQLPTEKGKGVLVTPTVDGNLLIGPNAVDIQDKEDTATTAEGQEEVLEKARLSVPGLNRRNMIHSFSGLRATPTGHDFIISPSKVNDRFIHAAGIESPGLTAAPAIGVRVAEILKDCGLELVEKESFNPYNSHIGRLYSQDEATINEMIAKDPDFGKIVCRCEKISEGEVKSNIHRTIGAGNLDALKRRTRLGMGRCQGGFCTCRAVELLSEELGIPMEEVTKSGADSKLLVCKTK